MIYLCMVMTYLWLQVMKLRQAKNELERKVQDQEEELDEQAGTIQQLEQVTCPAFYNASSLSHLLYLVCMRFCCVALN